MTLNQSSSNSSKYLLTQPVSGFDYEKLDTNIRAVVQQRTSEIRTLVRRTTQEIIEIGHKLTDVKAQLGHGNFGIWLKAEFDWSVRTANRFMQVAESFKLVNVTNLDITASALYFLASASTPQEARAEVLERGNNGEKINYTLVKQVVWEHKKATEPRPEKSASSNVDTRTVFNDTVHLTPQQENKTIRVRDILPEQVGKEVQTEVSLLSTQDTVSNSRVKDHLLVNKLEENEEQLEDIGMTTNMIVNPDLLPEDILETIMGEMNKKIEQLSEEELAQLTLAIINSAKNRLSKNRFSAILSELINLPC